MTTLILYTTAGCHLCQLAETILQTLSQQRDITLNPVEIGDDDKLLEHYGVSIPVIKFPNGDEIGWPFEAQDIDSKLNYQGISYSGYTITRNPINMT